MFKIALVVVALSASAAYAVGPAAPAPGHAAPPASSASHGGATGYTTEAPKTDATNAPCTIPFFCK